MKRKKATRKRFVRVPSDRLIKMCQEFYSRRRKGEHLTFELFLLEKPREKLPAKQVAELRFLLITTAELEEHHKPTRQKLRALLIDLHSLEPRIRDYLLPPSPKRRSAKRD